MIGKRMFKMKNNAVRIIVNQKRLMGLKAHRSYVRTNSLGPSSGNHCQTYKFENVSPVSFSTKII